MPAGALMGGEEGRVETQTAGARGSSAGDEARLLKHAEYFARSREGEPWMPCLCITGGPGSKVLPPLLLYIWGLLHATSPGSSAVVSSSQRAQLALGFCPSPSDQHHPGNSFWEAPLTKQYLSVSQRLLIS